LNEVSVKTRVSVTASIYEIEDLGHVYGESFEQRRFSTHTGGIFSTYGVGFTCEFQHGEFPVVWINDPILGNASSWHHYNQHSDQAN
jgi:hypothetical protein